MWKTKGLIDSLQWSLYFLSTTRKKTSNRLVFTLQVKKKKEEKRCFSKQMEESIWGRIRSGNMGFGIQTIWEASKYHHTSNKSSSQQGFTYINLRVIDSSLV